MKRPLTAIVASLALTPSLMPSLASARQVMTPSIAGVSQSESGQSSSASAAPAEHEIPAAAGQTDQQIMLSLNNCFSQMTAVKGKANSYAGESADGVTCSSDYTSDSTDHIAHQVLKTNNIKGDMIDVMLDLVDRHVAGFSYSQKINGVEANAHGNMTDGYTLSDPDNFLLNMSIAPIVQQTGMRPAAKTATAPAAATADGASTAKTAGSGVAELLAIVRYPYPLVSSLSDAASLINRNLPPRGWSAKPQKAPQTDKPISRKNLKKDMKRAVFWGSTEKNALFFEEIRKALSTENMPQFPAAAPAANPATPKPQ